jgi:hypothetical protein
MQVGTGDNVGIGGFIFSSGTIFGARPVLIRVLGPSLTLFGVPNALADPVLELHGEGGLTIANDNWEDDPGQVDNIQLTGLAPLSSRESAIYVTLERGAYTAVVRGKDNTTGTALVEVYDLLTYDQLGLGNVSTRAVVATGVDIVIAGVTMGGLWYSAGNDGVPKTGAGRIVARGIGPSLATIGVDDPLANPMLELRDVNGTLVMANDDWLNDPAQAAELASVHLEPRSPLESAFVVMLPKGAYTALLSGVNNSTGVGVVEIYDLNSD